MAEVPTIGKYMYSLMVEDYRQLLTQTRACHGEGLGGGGPHVTTVTMDQCTLHGQKSTSVSL